MEAGARAWVRAEGGRARVIRWSARVQSTWPVTTGTTVASQAARNFASLLDAVEHGETVVVTRDGVPVGRLAPERRTSADRLKDALREHPADDDFADELDAAHASLRAAFSDEVRGWPGG